MKAGIRASEKQNATTCFGTAEDKSSRMHSVVDSDSGEESSHSRRESIASSKTSPGILLRPAHVRKTLAKFEESVSAQSGTRKKSALDVEEETQTRNAEDSTIKGIMYKFEKALSSEPPTDEANRRFPCSQSNFSFQILIYLHNISAILPQVCCISHLVHRGHHITTTMSQDEQCLLILRLTAIAKMGWSIQETYRQVETYATRM